MVNEDKTEDFQEKYIHLEQRYRELLTKFHALTLEVQDRAPAPKAGYEERLMDVELKISKLWDILTDKKRTGEIKPSAFAKRGFVGRL